MSHCIGNRGAVLTTIAGGECGGANPSNGSACFPYFRSDRADSVEHRFEESRIMKRRTFLQAAGAATTGVTFGITPTVVHGEEPTGVSADRSAVCEAPRRTPVAADVDVLVVGAGRPA